MKYCLFLVIQQSSKHILIDAKKRFLGTLISGSMIICLFLTLKTYYVTYSLLYLLSIPGVVLASSQLIGGYEKNKAGVMSVCLTTVNMLVIVNRTVEIQYLVERLLATVIGSLFVLIVNIFFHKLMKKHKN